MQKTLELPWGLRDLDFQEDLYHPSFQLDPRGLVVPWGQGDLDFQGDLHHPCLRVGLLDQLILYLPWGLEVPVFHEIKSL